MGGVRPRPGDSGVGVVPDALTLWLLPPSGGDGGVSTGNRRPTTGNPFRGAGPRGGYPPVKRGLRLATKACIPSTWSAVPNVAWNSRRSSRTPWLSGVS